MRPILKIILASYWMKRSLDLFSGVGGISWALRGLMTPVMYCEREPRCHKVLQNLFQKEHLPDAPIHPDVCTLLTDASPTTEQDVALLEDMPIDFMVGGWPCFPAGALVTTTRGYVPIEHLIPGDQVWTHGGRFENVINTQRKPHRGTLINVDISHHPRTIQCTEEHPFWVREKQVLGECTHHTLNTYSEPRWVEAKDLDTTKHVVGQSINTNARVPEFEWCDVPGSSVRLDLEEQWWILGYFMADGGWLQKHRDTIDFTIADTPCKENILKRLSHEFDLHPRESDQMDDASGQSLTIKTKYRARDAFWWHLLHVLDKTTIPTWVLDAPVHLLQEFLDGYFAAADGSATSEDEHSWFMVTTSLEIALSMQAICSKIGCVASVSTSYGNAYTAYFVSMSYDVPDNRLFLEEGYMWHGLENVHHTQSDTIQYVYNCEVANDNSYHVDNIAVHNCVGFSSVGLRRGFENEQSGLYSEVRRLMDRLRPPFIFQENVPGVLTDIGLDGILESFEQSGYDAWWAVMPAYSVGAPQSRFRWYCLAVRKDVADGVELNLSEPYTPHPFHEGEPKDINRMIPERQSDFRSRLGMLGNSVVPDSVRRTFLTLWTGCRIPCSEVMAATSWSLRRPVRTNRPLTSNSATRRYGMYIDGCSEIMCVPPDMVVPKPDVGLVLDPEAFVSTVPHKAPPGNLVDRKLPAALWGTPRRGCIGSSNVLTWRGKNDLYTQLRFEHNTTNREGHPNVNFVEWLMGFPTDWTSLLKE
jgi:site-specific DNA-cytosine methylase